MRYRSLVRVTEPAVNPVTLEEAKAHLRIDSDAEDDLISALITAATRWAEDYCDRTFCYTQWKMSVDSFYGNVGSPVQFGLKADGNNIAGRQTVVPNLDLELPASADGAKRHCDRNHDHVHAKHERQHRNARRHRVPSRPSFHAWRLPPAVRANVAEPLAGLQQHHRHVLGGLFRRRHWRSRCRKGGN
jgi:hypothetical protein